MSPIINNDEYRVFSSYQDGSKALRNELKISRERMKASMHGHNLGQSIQKYKSELYIPNKSKFLLKKNAHLKRIMKENEGIAVNIIQNGPMYSKGLLL